MRSFEERRTEIFLRSAERIERRKSIRKKAILGCIPVALCVTVVSSLLLTGAKSTTAPDGSDKDADQREPAVNVGGMTSGDAWVGSMNEHESSTSVDDLPPTSSSQGSGEDNKRGETTPPGDHPDPGSSSGNSSGGTTGNNEVGSAGNYRGGNTSSSGGSAGDNPGNYPGGNTSSSGGSAGDNPGKYPGSSTSSSGGSAGNNPGNTPGGNPGSNSTVGSDEPTSEKGKEVIEIAVPPTSSNPNLHETLYWSALVIEGEIVEVRPKYNVPGDTRVKDKILGQAAIPYLIRVDAVYKGEVKPGDIIAVSILEGKYFVMNDDYTIDEDYEVRMSSGSSWSFYPDVGQKFLFCLKHDDKYSFAQSPSGEAGYRVVSDGDGVYGTKPRNSGQITLKTNSSHPEALRFASNLTIDLTTLADEIRESEKLSKLYSINNSTGHKEDDENGQENE